MVLWMLFILLALTISVKAEITPQLFSHRRYIMSKEEVFQILINKPSKTMVVYMGMVMPEEKYKSVIAEEKKHGYKN